MSTFLQDLRYALRLLRNAPGFAIVAVLALALGIGANTPIFSVVDAILLRPLPYQDPDRLVKIWTRFVGIDLPNDRNWVSAPEFMDFRTLCKSFSHIAAIAGDSFNITVGSVPERVEGVDVSTSFFPLLGVEAKLGRVFLPEEEQPGRDNVALLSDRLWRRRFGADPKVVGRKLIISGRSFIVVGILPPGFQYPPAAELWVPLTFSNDDLNPRNRGSHGLEVLGRIKPGLSLAQARGDMEAVAQRMTELHREYPYKQYRFGLIVTPLLEEMVGDIRTALGIATAYQSQRGYLPPRGRSTYGCPGARLYDAHLARYRPAIRFGACISGVEYHTRIAQGWRPRFDRWKSFAEIAARARGRRDCFVACTADRLRAAAQEFYAPHGSGSRLPA